jgi:hypothetical protein
MRERLEGLVREEAALQSGGEGLAVEARHVDRFRREALAVARLQHPHIVAVHADGLRFGLSQVLANVLVQRLSLRIAGDRFKDEVQLTGDGGSGISIRLWPASACTGRSMVSSSTFVPLPLVTS